MNEATQPFPQPTQHTYDLVRMLAEEVRQYRAEMTEACEKRPVVELAMIAARLAELQQTLDAFSVILASTAPEPEPEPVPVRRGHRAPKKSRSEAALRVVQSVIPVGGVAATLRSAGAIARAHGHAVAAATVATAAVAAPAVVVMTASSPPAHVAHQPRHAVSAAGQVMPGGAVPYYQPARHAQPDAARARPAAASPPPPPAPPVTAAPAPSPSPSLSPAPSPSQIAVIEAAQAVITFGPAGAGQVQLSAPGGPVSWTVSPVPGVTLSALSGDLDAGGTVAVVVSVIDPSVPGQVTLTFEPGSVTVTVSWPGTADGTPGVP